MVRGPEVPRYVAFGLAMLVAVVGSAFIVGETFADPGGLTAVVLVAAWGLPMIALSVYAIARPQTATTALVVIAVLVTMFILLDSAFRLLPDGIGPVGAIAMFALAVAVDFLGLRRPTPAGSILVLLGVAGLVAAAWKVTEPGETVRVGAALGGSSGAVAVAVLVVGCLFLLAGGWEAWAGHRSHSVRPAP